jgi:hypothetical protein
LEGSVTVTLVVPVALAVLVVEVLLTSWVLTAARVAAAPFSPVRVKVTDSFGAKPENGIVAVPPGGMVTALPSGATGV